IIAREDDRWSGNTGNERAVKAAGEVHADRYFSLQTQLDRVVHQVPQFLHGSTGSELVVQPVWWGPIANNPQGAVADNQVMRREQLFNPGKERVVGQRVFKDEKVLWDVGCCFDVRKEAFDLRSEVEDPALKRVVEGFLAHTIAGGEQPLAVPDGEGE